MHQHVYQLNPARANSARYSQGHGIWAFQHVQVFWRMNVVQSRDNPSWQEGQQHFHKLKTTCSQSVDLIAYSVDLAWFIANLVQRCQRASVKLPTNTKYRDIKPCKGTQQIDSFKLWWYSTWLGTWTSQEDLKFFHLLPPWKRFENEVAPRPPEEPEHRLSPYHRAGASTGGHPGHRISSGRCHTSPHWCAHPGSFPWSLPPRHCQRCPPAQR